MNFRIKGGSLAVAIALSWLTVAGTSAQEKKGVHHHYKLIDLGTLGGPGSTTTEGSQQVLSNSSVMVGGGDTVSLNPYPNRFNPFKRSNDNVEHAFVWQRGVVTDLGTLPGGSASFPFWINADGLIAGGSELAALDPDSGTPEFHAVLWQNHKIHDLGTLGGTSSLAVDVNNSWQVTGFALNEIADPFSMNCVYGGICPSTQTRAFLWKNGEMQDLGTVGGPDSFAQYVNDRAQVAGVSYTSDVTDPNTGLPHLDPFLWENGKMKDLGNFGGTNSFL